MDIYKFFISEKDRLIVEITEAEKKLHDSPKGNISINTRNSGKYMYLKHKGEKSVYIRKNEYKRYLPHIRKLYYEKRLKHNKMYLNAIDRFLKEYNPKLQPAEEFLQENPDIAKVLCMKIKPSSKKTLDWFEEEYRSDPPYPEKRIIKTIHGEMVRSKSECMIADSLLLGGIPYRYEWARKFGDATLHPNFIILHPATGEFYIWEHLGVADNSEYLEENIKKLEIYAMSGFIAGKNLIITTESAAHPLDSDTVNMVIKRFFPDLCIFIWDVMYMQL